jgi:Holliday junction resolvase RusA-like endonuclease
MSKNKGKIIRMDIKPVSVNACWQGRRFKTDDYKKYERDASLILSCVPREEFSQTGKIELNIKFYFQRVWNKDLDNFLKPLLDILTKNRLIADDRFIAKLTVEKMQSASDYIEIQIKEYKRYD